MNKYQDVKTVYYDRNKRRITKYCIAYYEATGISISPSEIIKKKNDFAISILRHAIATILYNKGRYFTYARVGQMLNRHHSTIVHSVKLSKYDSFVIQAIKDIENNL